MMVTNGFCSIPPSELVLATGGALSLGKTPVLNFPTVVIVAVLGNVVGNVAMYSIARYKGRKWCLKFLENWEKLTKTKAEEHKGINKVIYLCAKFIPRIKINHIHWMDKMFDKFGYGIIFFTRVAPVIRSAWSIPAGISKMNFIVFTVFCAIGSAVYALMNGWLGGKLKEKWQVIESSNMPVRYIIIGVVLLLAAFLLYKKFLRKKGEFSLDTDSEGGNK